MQPVSKNFKANAYLFHENDHSRELYVVQSGTIKITRRIGRGDIDLAILEKGAVFGEMALIDGKPRSASAQTVSDSLVTIIDAETFHSRVGGVPPWYMSIVRMTCQKIRKANERTLSLSTRSIDGAMILLLYRQCFGRQPDVCAASGGSLSVAIASTQQIALLGVSEERFNGCIGFLCNHNFIHLDHSRIICDNQEEFSRYVAFITLAMRHAYDKHSPIGKKESDLMKGISELYPSITHPDGGKTDIPGDVFLDAVKTHCPECRPIQVIKHLKELGAIAALSGEKADSSDQAHMSGTITLPHDTWAKIYLWNTFNNKLPSL